ncbi:MAG: hypothetical protein KHX13_04770 [Acidaminococcus intestini]|uniref:Uncharacterized protein n=1 Tax=Acidaminococcus intestini TaxID=187327 RepID=A0A943EKH7_9FIRM|nr:hypothetical protein [Acidaminococcus intestini]
MVITICDVKYNTNDRHYWYFNRSEKRWERIGLARILEKYRVGKPNTQTPNIWYGARYYRNYVGALYSYGYYVKKGDVTMSRYYYDFATFNGRLLSFDNIQILRDLHSVLLQD